MALKTIDPHSRRWYVDHMVAVRSYTEADYEAARSLWVHLTHHHRDIYDAPSIGGDDPGAGLDEHLTKHGPDELIVAELDGNVVGLGGLILGDTSAEIEPVIVDPAMRGHGVGRRIIDTLRDKARDLGLNEFTVRVVGRNADAISFYKSMGLQTVGMVELFEFLDSDRKWQPGAVISGVELDV